MMRIVLILLTAVTMLGGCAMSREDRLRDRADKIEDKLIDERDRVVALPAADPDRAPRLSNLNSLKTSLSAVNIGLGSAKYLPENRRDVAYDIIEEAYSTIEWNIPLKAGDAGRRPMPEGFVNGKLDLK